MRLALSPGGIGLELASSVRLGPVEVASLALRLDELRFPLDLTGGVARFRHRRGRLTGGVLAAPPDRLAAHAAQKLRGQLGAGAVHVTVAPFGGGLSIGITADSAALAFDVVAAPLERDLRLLVEEARGLGLPDAAHVVAGRLVGALLGPVAERVGGAFVLRDPFGAVARRLLPDAGVRAPTTEGVVLDLDDAGAGAGRLIARVGEPARLTLRAVRALEAAELCADADAAAVEGDRDRARALYVAALERAPRHPEITARLAATDMAAGERAEAALATLAELGALVDAGLLGSMVLEAVGERQAAYAAAARAAAAEPFGALAALAWLRAARLSDQPRATEDALDQALVRGPALAEARWERLAARLAKGDLRGALADAQHAEAAAPTPEARHDACRRAAHELLARGFAAQAQQLFERALRHRPRSAEAVAGLAAALRDLGKPRRALDLFARAADLSARSGARDHALDLEVARLLASYAADRPAAVARAAAVPQEAPDAPEARLLEAQWRAELGDVAGASRAAARLRSIAESKGAALEGGVSHRGLAARLVELAHLEEGMLSDPRAAERDLALALRLHPEDREAARALRRLGLARTAPSPDPAAQALAARAPVAPAATPAPRSPPEEAPEDPAEDEALAERLIAKLRADPKDVENADRLAAVLERLGRELELLALVSGRIDEAPEHEREALLERRDQTLRRLAERARADGRDDEASLYDSMISR